MQRIRAKAEQTNACTISLIFVLHNHKRCWLGQLVHGCNGDEASSAYTTLHWLAFNRFALLV